MGSRFSMCLQDRMKTKLLILVVALGALAAHGQTKPVYSDIEAGKHVGEEATVTGKLASVFTSSKGTTFLNLGDRFPRHTFGGVIFAGNQAAVGDVKQYEGKDVTLTGRIELSPDKKPQIVINRADQVALAGAVMPAPPVPTPAATTPMPAPPAPTTAAAPTPSAPPPEKPMGKINLSTGWESPQRGGDLARKDLAKLFGSSGSASETTRVETTLELYPGITFLTPLATARKTLNLDGLQYAKSKISTSGFPQDSFSSHQFSGVFRGGFNKLHLITDNDDQVVSVLAVDSSPRARVLNEVDSAGFHTYNFVSGGSKATGSLAIRHQVVPGSAATGVLVVETLLIDPNDPEDTPVRRTSKSKSSIYTRQKTGKVLERSRWHVPVPIVNLILRCSVGG